MRIEIVDKNSNNSEDNRPNFWNTKNIRNNGNPESSKTHNILRKRSPSFSDDDSSISVINYSQNGSSQNNNFSNNPLIMSDKEITHSSYTTRENENGTRELSTISYKTDIKDLTNEDATNTFSNEIVESNSRKFSQENEELSIQERRKRNMNQFLVDLQQKELQKLEIEKENKKRKWKEEDYLHKKQFRRKTTYRDLIDGGDMKDFIVEDEDESPNLIHNYSNNNLQGNNKNKVITLNLVSPDTEKINKSDIKLINEDIMEARIADSSQESSREKTPSPILNHVMYAQEILNNRLYSPIKQKRRPEYYFSLYIRFLTASCHPILGKSFQNVCLEQESDTLFFGEAIENIEESISHKMRTISSPWTKSFLNIISQFPRIKIYDISNSNRECIACRKHHNYDITIRFFGSKYITLKSFQLEYNRPYSKDIFLHFGIKCKDIVLLYHTFCHFKTYSVKYIENEWGKYKEKLDLNEDDSEITMKVSKNAENFLLPIWREMDDLNFELLAEPKSLSNRLDTLIKKIESIYIRANIKTSQSDIDLSRRRSKLYHEELDHIESSTYKISDNPINKYEDIQVIHDLTSPISKNEAKKDRNSKQSTQNSYDFDLSQKSINKIENNIGIENDDDVFIEDIMK